jgi:hypothetical protein
VFDVLRTQNVESKAMDYKTEWSRMQLEEKYSELLQSHASLCGKIEEHQELDAVRQQITEEFAREFFGDQEGKLWEEGLTLSKLLEMIRDKMREKDTQIEGLQKRIEMIGKVATKDFAPFPKRLDEMTEMEAKIARVACDLCGDMSFIKDLVENRRTEIGPAYGEVCPKCGLLGRISCTCK